MTDYVRNKMHEYDTFAHGPQEGRVSSVSRSSRFVGRTTASSIALATLAVILAVGTKGAKIPVMALREKTQLSNGSRRKHGYTRKRNRTYIKFAISVFLILPSIRASVQTF